MSKTTEASDLLACPCCTSLTISELGGYEICDVCGWEDDPIQSQHPNQAGGANKLSLVQAREKWRTRQTEK